MTALSYRYKALDRAGEARTGSLAAANRQEALRKIAAQGLMAVSIRQESGESARTGRRISTKDIAHFTYQLGVLVGARIPISDGLMSIAEQEKDRRLKQVISDIAVRIEAGEPLASAMRAYSHVFGDVYVQTIQAAEQSGNLVKVLEHLSEMLERSAETARQVRGAFIYPLCVLAVLAAAVVFLVGVVIPRFAGMFESRGMDLPLLTELLMIAGRSMRAWWFLYLAGAAGAVFGVRAAWRNSTGRAAIDRFLHLVPIMKELLVGLAVARFCRVFGITLGSGLPLMDCLDLAGRATGRPMMQRDVALLIDQVRHGRRLTEAFRSCAYIPPFARRMFAAGEESAELTRMSAIVARHYEQESTHLAKGVATVIEPALIVLIAAVVLIVALAIFLPMWNMVNLVG